MAAACEDDEQAQETVAEQTQEQLRAVTLLHVGWRDQHAQKQASRVGERVTLASFDLLALIVTTTNSRKLPAFDTLAIDESGAGNGVFFSIKRVLVRRRLSSSGSSTTGSLLFSEARYLSSKSESRRTHALFKMTQDRLQRWIDKHFQTVVPILAIIGCCRWGTTSDSILALSVTILPFLCGSVGCYLWALYLRKNSPIKWLFLGLFPALPQLYLFGWHRCLNQKKASTEKSVDCPRCGTYMRNSVVCPNCRWSTATS